MFYLYIKCFYKSGNTKTNLKWWLGVGGGGGAGGGGMQYGKQIFGVNCISYHVFYGA